MVKILKCQVARSGLDPDLFGFHGSRHGTLPQCDGALSLAVIAEPSLELTRVQSAHVSDAIFEETDTQSFTDLIYRFSSLT